MTAAATRKLQKEIETALKKVDDGIGEFAEYWEQATTASSRQQKEKLGEELKTSINKLQRLRAQIREWIAQSGVQTNSKDKLEDARRRIENDMQRFKDFERDLKTKAFSKCALSREDEVDGEEAERLKYQDWLSQTIQTLNDQLDGFEADLEVLNNKKSLSSDDKSRLEQLKTLQERHRWHIKKLELLLRALDNEALDMNDLVCISDTVELYVENHEDPDCYHDEALYDCFDLVEFEEKTPKPSTPSAAVKDDPGTPASSKEEPHKKVKEKEKKRKEDKKDKKKEERDKKASSTPSGTPVAASSAKSAAVNVTPGGGGAKSPAASDAEGKVDPLRANLDPDEVKVQEDQLLGEAEEFICKICQIHVVGCSPKLTSCSHLFCGDCIAQWFAQHPESQTWAQRARTVGPERVVPCPVCKQPLNEKKDLYPVCGVTSRSENLLLWRMLSSLKIVCANHPKVSKDGKCQWIGEYGSYQKHIAVCKNCDTILPEKPESGDAKSAPVQRADSESEAGSVPPSKDASRKGTPAIGATPPPAARMAPAQLPSPALTSAPKSPPSAPANAATIAGPAAQGATTPGRAQSAKQPAVKPSPDHPPKGVAAAQAPSPAPSAPAAVSPATPASAPPAPATPPLAGIAGAPTRAPTAAAAPTPAPAPTLPASVAVAAAPQAPATSPEPKAVAPAHAPSVTAVATSAAPAGAAAGAAAAASVICAASGGSQVVVAGRRAPQHETAPAAEQQEADGVFVAAAVSPFEPTGVSMIPVSVGDFIKVLEQHASGWTYAQNLSLPGTTAGWVPSWIVQSPPAAAEPKPKVVQPAPAPAPAPVQPAAAVQAVAAPAPAPTQEVRVAKQRAVAPFSATSSSQLTLSPGDLVEVVERHSSGWTYGRKDDSEGWFPDWVVSSQR